ncbi:tol-pal system protein YbgF [Rhizobium paknamense]|uniref:Cell division coordinator CpoB n=1 Tax=Rhizobium paknamense TaxID=1206817 RepID=A0ABU0IFM6_9HYPH|nr:tol-pal system protein YbgF [Rhizobium paknamense]MDQ0457051.1 tol-pal system protein YbgF [Rhizobium paknamense]
MKRLVLAGIVGASAILAPMSSSYAFSLFGHSRPPVPAPSAEVQQIQSNDTYRIQQLEEQVRQLNGLVEDMRYQLLQMQEQLRKTQEDNEFRFQELEKKRSDAGGSSEPSVASRQPAPPASTPAAPSGDGVGQIIEDSGQASAGSRAAPGESTLGSIQMDSSGNPVGVTQNGQAGQNASRGGAAPGAAPTKTASTGGENDLYQVAYSHVLSGDYKAAEGEFKDFLSRYPQSGKAADASFWLGEAQYSQERYKDAAETFLKSYQSYGKSPKAPEMLLKLGMSLAALDNKDTACATLREVNKRYPNASKAVQTKVASEQKRLACG